MPLRLVYLVNFNSILFAPVQGHLPCHCQSLPTLATSVQFSTALLAGFPRLTATCYLFLPLSFEYLFYSSLYYQCLYLSLLISTLSMLNKCLLNKYKKYSQVKGKISSVIPLEFHHHYRETMALHLWKIRQPSQKLAGLSKERTCHFSFPNDAEQLS